MMTERRVVVTGLGLVSAFGNGIGLNWKKIINGECAIKSTKLLGPSFDMLKSKVASWVDLESLHESSEKLPKFIRMAQIASREAIKQSVLNADKNKIGTSVGSGMSPLDFIFSECEKLKSFGSRKISPYFIPKILPNMAAGQISIENGFKGPLLSQSTACASAAHSIGDAYRLIKHGYADMMIAGGTEAAVNIPSMAGFDQARALSTKYNDYPLLSSRPFDLNRNGFVIGEGSGIMVLKSLELVDDDEVVYGEIVGYGCTSDAHHMTAPDPQGNGAELAMKRSLEEAKILPHQIGYINAHATATPIGDVSEAAAIYRLFGTSVPVSSNKGSIGHLLGASGAIEAIFTILALHHNTLPINLNFTSSCPHMSPLNIIQNAYNHPTSNFALSNSFGFGGTNVSLCFKTFK